MTIHD
jgi:hypothetical protein